jgi:hypothetical protein
VEVFDPLPHTAFVDVGDDLTAVEASNEFHRFVALGACSGAAWLDGPRNGSTFSYGGCIAHGQ